MLLLLLLLQVKGRGSGFPAIAAFCSSTFTSAYYSQTECLTKWDAGVLSHTRRLRASAASLDATVLNGLVITLGVGGATRRPTSHHSEIARRRCDRWNTDTRAMELRRRGVEAAASAHFHRAPNAATLRLLRGDVMENHSERLQRGNTGV